MQPLPGVIVRAAIRRSAHIVEVLMRPAFVSLLLLSSLGLITCDGCQEDIAAEGEGEGEGDAVVEGCGCNGTTAQPTSLALFGVGLALLRRRRR